MPMDECLGLNLGTCSDAEVAETAKEFASYGQEDPPVEEKARVSAAPRRAEKREKRLSRAK